MVKLTIVPNKYNQTASTYDSIFKEFITSVRLKYKVVPSHDISDKKRIKDGKEVFNYFSIAIGLPNIQMKSTEKIKVLLVDDHQLIRDGVRSMLENTDDLEVIGSVASGEDSINEVRENRPDVILMDIMMGGMTGIEATRWIKDFDPSVKVVLLTMEISKEYVSAGIKSGVDGYLPKDVDKETLLNAIRMVRGGGRFFNDAIMKLVFEDFYTHEKLKSTDKKLPNDLTKREHEILGLVASGKTNKELAEALFISIKTVETHKTHIMEKLGLRNTTELVKYAIKNKIISIDSL